MVAELLEQKRVYLPLFGYIPKKRIARLKQYMWVCNYIYIYIFFIYICMCVRGCTPEKPVPQPHML